METGEFLAELVAGCRATPGVTTLAVFGSTASAGAPRRDEWSDLDFAVFATPGDAVRVGAEWAFLPRPDELVLTAREHDNGGVALYADGTLLEFGAGRPWEVTDPTCEVLLGGADLRLGLPPAEPDAANSVRLFLAKVLIGVGRVRRGEVLAGGLHIRCHALGALAAALRNRVPPPEVAEPNAFDPLRRFEAAYPRLGERLAAAVDRPAEAAGLALFRLAREVLEPGWPEFPSRAADVVALRLGWTTAQLPQLDWYRHQIAISTVARCGGNYRLSFASIPPVGDGFVCLPCSSAIDYIGTVGQGSMERASRQHLREANRDAELQPLSGGAEPPSTA